MSAHRPTSGLLRAAATLLTTMVVFFCFCAGAGFVLEVPATLAFGWPWYLWRVVPRLDPDPWAVASAAAYLVGVMVGGHLFLRWVYAASGPPGEPRRWPWTWTLRLVGLVVLMFVSGIAVTGIAHQTGWLIRSPEPLLSGRRDVVARIKSVNNLKQIAIAAHSAHDDRGELPRSRFDATGRPLHSWQTAMLPYIEEDPLYRRIDPSKPWSHPDNAAVMGTPVRVFLNPTVPTDRVGEYAATHYAGNVAVVLTDASRTMNSFPAGMSNTVLAGEVRSNVRAWGDPLNARDLRLGANAHPDGFGAPGRPPQFAMLDGSVRTLDPQALAAVAAGRVPE